jgi:hypothetical protein
MKKTLLTTAGILILGVASFAQSLYQTSPTPRPSRTSSTYGSSYGSTSQTNSNTRYQEGYYRSNGTYVEGHNKTQSNNTNSDNYSTSGNTNPYTKQQGTRAQDYSSDAYNYGQGRQIQTGERGGQYYINRNGNKTYVPKRD